MTQPSDYAKTIFMIESQLAERKATVAALKAGGHCVRDAERELRPAKDMLRLLR